MLNQLNQLNQIDSDVYLIKEIKNGSGDAFRILAERYNYIISYNLSKLYSPASFSSFGSLSFSAYHYDSDREDMFQECRIILFKAAKYYDFMKNVKFSTYANVCIKNYLISIRRKFGRIKKHARYDFVPLDEIREDGSESIARYDSYFAFSDFNSFAGTEVFFDDLSAFEKKVLAMYIENRSYKYMADILNKSVKSIDNAISRIRSKLKPYAEYFISE